MSFLRNPAICRIFREAHLIEKLGTGLIALFNSYMQMELPTPHVLEGTSFVKCVLPRSTPETSLLQQKNALSDELKSIYDLFGIADEVTVSHVMKTLNLPRATAGRRLAILAKANLIIKRGQGRTAHYVRNTVKK